MDVTDWVMTGLGAALVVVGLRDVVQTLWHPSGEGSLSRRASAAVWRLARAAGPWARTSAGPTVLVTVVAMWVLLIVVGCALVYLPHLSDGVSYSTGLDTSDRRGLLDALYLSTVVLATLGFGDVVPTEGWLRLVMPLEALIGFSLLTAGVSWVLQIERTLSNRRTLARHLSLLRRAEEGTGAVLGDPHVVDELARDVAGVHVDLAHSAVTYYFADTSEGDSLASALPYACRLAERTAHESEESLRLAGSALDLALDDLAEVLRGRFVPGDGDREEVFRRFASQHGTAR